MPDGFSAGDTAFVLISAALVMVMTPGLAFFYGGMVRAKSTLNMLAMSFLSLGIVSVLSGPTPSPGSSETWTSSGCAASG